ncbi:chromatin assembly factor 1 subunit b-like [Plakobranchus ocellatus]|uniref:Chromatin assembly factor 1 subunit b-like n=1 Tax=Plakobranchus ocellatus TaxID=259542 RepID=A0AAV4DG95_9GAST|nr:chromatin assembly factor 1 subunit b-like [Plakobranchus ocellatus]
MFFPFLVPEKDEQPEWERKKSMFCLPYRMVFAVATEDSVLIYDTQQTMPVGLLKNIHYHQISDLSWSRDGQALIVSSTDGFCTVATFEENELGIPYTAESSGDSEASGSPGKVIQTAVEVDGVDADPASKPVLSLTNSDSEKNLEAIKEVNKGSGSETSPNSIESDTKATDMKELQSSSVSEKSDSDRKEEKVAGSIRDMTIKESQPSNSDSMEIANSGPSVPSKEEPKKKRIQFTTLSLNK